MKKKLFILLLALFASGAMMAQTIVSTTPSNKNVILEEFTGINCTFCPDGHRMANELMANNPGRVFGINVHEGGYAANTYTTPFGTALAAQTGLAGYPAGTVNRHAFTSPAPQGNPGTTALSRGDWGNAANQIMGQASCVNVAAVATIDMATRQISIDVEYYYTANSAVTSNKLNIAILQNNVLGPQVGGATYNPSQMVNGQYSHQHMLRHLVTGQWGDDITTTTATTFESRNYIYDVPVNIGGVDAELDELNIIVFIAEGQQEIITGCEAEITYLNAAPKLVSITEIPALNCDLEMNTYATVKNISESPVTSVELTYTSGSSNGTIQWDARTIAVGATDTIHIPAITVTSGTAQDLTVNISKINGSDITTTPKTISLEKTVAQGGGYMSFELATDRYSSETTFKFAKADGTVILQGGPWPDRPSNGITQRWFALLPPEAGCYYLEVSDSYGDGINAGYGSGYFKVYSTNSDVLIHNNGQFNSSATYFIYADRPAGVEDGEMEFSIYPNPVHSSLSIEANEPIEQIQIFNIQGQLMMSQQGDVNQIGVSQLATGIYMIRIITDNGVTVKRFVKE